MRSSLVLGSLCSIVLVVGCNDPPAGTDAAVIGDAGRDAGPTVEDGGTDGGSDAGGDAGPVVCGPTNCSGDHACVRGVCVLTCGADTTTFDAALATDLEVLGTVCRTPQALTVVGTNVYEVSTSLSGMETTFTLSRWTRGSETPSASTLATAHYTAPDGATMVYAGGYVAVSSDEMHAVFGYTTSAAGAVGGVFDVATGTGTATEIAADGNFDAEFADATHYLVNGTVGGTQGLYRATSGGTSLTQVVSSLGEYSGAVALWSDEGVLLAGGSSFTTNWADGMTGNRVLVLDAAAVLGVTTTPVDGSTVQQLTMPSAFELLDGGRVASIHYDATFAIDAIEVRTLTRAAGTGTVTASAPASLTTGSAFSSVAAAGTDIVLSFGGGLLFVR